MTMSKRAQRAFDELKELGASVMHWGPEEGYSDGVAFVLIWANDDGEVFACIEGRRVKERIEGDRVVNPCGYRQDVHEILKKHELVTDWETRGQVAVYEDREAPGFKHWRQ